MMQTKKRKRILALQSKNQQNPGLLLFYLFTKKIRFHNLHHHFPNTRQYDFHLCPHIRRDHWRRHRRMACQCFLQDKKQIILMRFLDIFGHFPPRCGSTMGGYIQLTINISNAVSIPICDDEAADSSFQFHCSQNGFSSVFR